MRQHLTAVQAAAKVGNAEVAGAAIGSMDLTFKPGKVQPGHFDFAIGTAGSMTLVLQTILPALLLASGKSTLALEGGTHNPFAPPWDFLAKTFLPLILWGRISIGRLKMYGTIWLTYCLRLRIVRYDTRS